MTSPDPELLRAEFLGMSVRHRDVGQDRRQASLLLAQHGERFDLTRLEFADGGAMLSGASGTELVLRPNQTAAAGVMNLGFHEGRRRVLALLEEGLGQHVHDELWIDDITLVAAWDTEDADGARRYLTDRVLGLDRERRELLDEGDDQAAHGLRMWRRLGVGSLECAIEPLHTDPGQIYVRLVYSQEEPVANAMAVGACTVAVNEFLHGPLAAFVRARTRDI
jgi:hypothetical protein